MDGAEVTEEELFGFEELELEEELLGFEELEEELLGLEELALQEEEFPVLSSSSSGEIPEPSSFSVSEVSSPTVSETELSNPLWNEEFSFFPHAASVSVAKRKISAHSQMILDLIFFIFTSFFVLSKQYCQKISQTYYKRREAVRSIVGKRKERGYLAKMASVGRETEKNFGFVKNFLQAFSVA